MLSAARRVIESGWYILGKEGETFEKQWAEICGVPFGVGLGNGMDALEIALKSLDIGAGDEVITSPMTAFATVLAIIRAGATPVLADIESGSGLLSLSSVKRCMSPKTKAIILVHLYGQIRSMGAWVDFCNVNNIHLIEDCAQAHLASWQGKVAGSFGIAGAFSFYPTKNLGAIGDAGMLVTHDEALANRAVCLRNYGQTSRYEHAELGLNSRMDELHAAILSARLQWLDAFTERRRQIAAHYFSGIQSDFVRLLAEPEEYSAHVYHLFVVVSEHRGALQAYLLENGIQTLIHYPLPVQRQKPTQFIKRDPRGLAACDQHASKCLSLPCHPQLTGADIAQVIGAVNRFVPK